MSASGTVPWSGRPQHPLAQQVDLGPAVALPLDQLQSVTWPSVCPLLWRSVSPACTAAWSARSLPANRARSSMPLASAVVQPRRQPLALPPAQHDQEVLGELDRRGDGGVLGTRAASGRRAARRSAVRGAAGRATATSRGGGPWGLVSAVRGRPVGGGPSRRSWATKRWTLRDGVGEALGPDLPPEHRRRPAALVPALEEVGLVGFEDALLAVDAVPLALGRAFAQVLVDGHPRDPDRARDLRRRTRPWRGGRGPGRTSPGGAPPRPRPPPSARSRHRSGCGWRRLPW